MQNSKTSLFAVIAAILLIAVSVFGGIISQRKPAATPPVKTETALPAKIASGDYFLEIDPGNWKHWKQGRLNNNNTLVKTTYGKTAIFISPAGKDSFDQDTVLQITAVSRIKAGWIIKGLLWINGRVSRFTGTRDLDICEPSPFAIQFGQEKPAIRTISGENNPETFVFKIYPFKGKIVLVFYAPIEIITIRIHP